MVPIVLILGVRNASACCCIQGLPLDIDFMLFLIWREQMDIKGAGYVGKEHDVQKMPMGVMRY